MLLFFHFHVVLVDHLLINYYLVFIYVQMRITITQHLPFLFYERNKNDDVAQGLFLFLHLGWSKIQSDQIQGSDHCSVLTIENKFGLQSRTKLIYELIVECYTIFWKFLKVNCMGISEHIPFFFVILSFDR